MYIKFPFFFQNVFIKSKFFIINLAMFYCKENDKVIETGVLVLFQMLFFYLLNKFIFQDQ